MTDLFKAKPIPPLAEALRPTTLDEVVGQSHLLGPGKPLRIAFESGRPHSMILWGPPGVGKTTLARLTAQAFDCAFIAISAVFAGVKDIRAAMDEAQMTLEQYQRRTLLFVDEIHRFNKAQQDALLPFVESGLVTFIGATTENPSFEVNAALLSRAQVYVLQSLNENELRELLARAQATVLRDLQFEEVALDTLIGYADGDARRFLSLLEQASVAAQNAGQPMVDSALVENALSMNARRFDKGGDNFYDQISALHKSVRGSSPDGALYWLTELIQSICRDGSYVWHGKISDWQTLGRCKSRMMPHRLMKDSDPPRVSLLWPKPCSTSLSRLKVMRVIWPITKRSPILRAIVHALCRFTCGMRRLS